MSENVLVIAFDGLDKELIEEFGLEHITQEEFGGIDNTTGMSSIKTSELFASFITGETWEKHMVKGLESWNDEKGKILDNDIFNFAEDNIRGGYRLKKLLSSFLGLEKSKSSKKNLMSESLFEKIPNSKAIDVPGYNPSPFWDTMGRPFQLKRADAEERRITYYWDEWEYDRRKRNLFKNLNTYFDFLMAHFHRPDFYHHIYGDRDVGYDKNELRELYKETDELAGEIKEYFSEDYDLIIFMSDHGLPTEKEHNENAFYSCNRELFGSSIPKILDFHDKILEKVD